MKKILFSFIIALSFSSCSNDKDEPKDGAPEPNNTVAQFEDIEFLKFGAR